MGVLLVGRSPEFAQQLRLGYHAAGVLDQEREQCVLLARQRQRLAGKTNLAPRQVDMEPAVESLNVAVAAGVILFEARRQLIGLA